MVGIIAGSDLWERRFELPAKDRYERTPVWISRDQWVAWHNQAEDPFYIEGWDLIAFGSSPKGVTIRLERADGEGWFRTDAQALAYVKRRAQEGSKFHQHALSLIGETY